MGRRKADKRILIQPQPFPTTAHRGSDTTALVKTKPLVSRIAPKREPRIWPGCAAALAPETAGSVNF